MDKNKLMSAADLYAEGLRSLFPVEQGHPFLFEPIVTAAKKLILENLPRERAAILKQTPVVMLQMTNHTVSKMFNDMTDVDRQQWIRVAYLDAGVLRVPGAAEGNVIVIGSSLPLVLKFLANFASWCIGKSGEVSSSDRIEISNAIVQLFSFMHAKRKIDKLPDFMAN